MSLREQFTEALAHHQAGRLVEAEAAYRKILAEHPAHADAWNLLGAVASQTGRNVLAIQLIGRALTLMPDNAVAHSNLGYALTAQRRLDEAVSHLEKALALKPDYADAHLNLATALATQNKLDEAVAAFHRTLAVKPDYVKAYVNLGDTLLRQGKRGEALQAGMEAARRISTPSASAGLAGALLAACGNRDEAIRLLNLYLQVDPDDRQGAWLLLAKLGAAAVPERTSDAQITALYTRRAESWDKSPYHGHILVADAVQRLADKDRRFDILDAGCGTGLLGPLLAPIAKRLDGVDLSPAMLAKAEDKRIYTTLHQGDLVRFMAVQPEWFDIVASAATLIHFSDLQPVFTAVATTLRPGGLFVFTVFPDAETGNDTTAIALTRSGCFTHSPQAIRDWASATGFDVELMETHIHEYRDGAPLNGLVVGLRRAPAGQSGGST